MVFFELIYYVYATVWQLYLGLRGMGWYKTLQGYHHSISYKLIKLVWSLHLLENLRSVQVLRSRK